MKAYLACDIGKVRTENQDCVRFEKLSDGILALVCDGMGGMQNGSAASRIAITTAAESFLQRYQPGMTPPEVSALLRICAVDANHSVYREAVHGAEPSRMGSTLVAAYVRQNTACIVNVGDSRAYLIPAEGEVRQLTTDHTVVQLLYEKGVITADERATHIRRNELMRAIGVSARVLPDTHIVTLNAGDRLLLCSDGLYGMLTPGQITEVCRSCTSEEFPERAVSAANANGGRDNISVVLVDPA